jgi:hypothetical protein
MAITTNSSTSVKAARKGVVSALSLTAGGSTTRDREIQRILVISLTPLIRRFSFEKKAKSCTARRRLSSEVGVFRNSPR